MKLPFDEAERSCTSLNTEHPCQYSITLGKSLPHEQSRPCPFPSHDGGLRFFPNFSYRPLKVVVSTIGPSSLYAEKHLPVPPNSYFFKYFLEP